MVDNALWLASVFGPFLAIIGLWMLLYSDNMLKVMTSVKNTPGVFYMISIVNLLIGLAILSEYDLWMWDMPLLVTLLGWFLILRAVLMLFIPQLAIKWMMTQKKNSSWHGLIPLVWGLALCWFAFL